MTRTSSLEVSVKTYIDCILYIDCSICFIIVHMVAFVNLILKKMMMMMMMMTKPDTCQLFLGLHAIYLKLSQFKIAEFEV